MIDNKTFWKAAKPFFTDKGINNYLLKKVRPILIIKIYQHGHDIRKIKYIFAVAVKNVNLPQYEHPSVNTDHIEDSIIKSVEKFKNHQSIKLIKGSFLNNSTFSFDEIPTSDIEIIISDTPQLRHWLNHAIFVGES